MADQIPAPVLDDRDEDRVTAEVIGSLPSELSDRSDSNPAVVMAEALGAFYGKALYQINRWPRAVIQKCLAMVGVTLEDATPGTVTQTFTLSAPQVQDTVIPTGTNVATSDGEIVYATTSDLTIAAYTTPTGTIAMTSGSPTVTGTSTSFVTGSTWEGYQIRAVNGTWYTIESVASTTSLTLTENAAATVSGVAFQVGPITGTVGAQSTSTGLDQGVNAGDLSVLQSAVSGVSSTTNAAASSGQADQETVENALARAPKAFATRDVACSETDYAEFARKILGQNGRAVALLNQNLGTTGAAGYVTIGLLSPDWTTSSTVTAQERSNVMRDLAARSFGGATLIDTPALITEIIPAAIVWRKTAYDEPTTRIAIAEALNTLYSPNTYPWGRTLLAADQAEAIEACEEVDSVAVISGVLACGFDYVVSTGTIAFTNGSATATAANLGTDATNMDAAVTARTPPIIIDPVGKDGYVVKAVNTGTGALTLDRAFTGVTVTATHGWFKANSKALQTDDTANYSLPYASLSTDEDSLPDSIIIVGDTTGL